MKKIENMNIDETRQAFSKFEAKHTRNDDLDMSGLQLTRYAECLEKANREELFDLISGKTGVVEVTPVFLWLQAAPAWKAGYGFFPHR